MKRFINFLLCAALFFTVQSCVNDDAGFEADVTGNEVVAIEISQGALLKTRASVDANMAEEAMKHVDVLIFEESGAFLYSERFVVNGPEGTVRLSRNRRDLFVKDAAYFVHVIANSTHAHSTFSSLADLDSLHALKQVDERVHITGSPMESAPTHFLMDGAAYLLPGEEPVSPAPVVLYDGNDNEPTNLKVNLRRAVS